MLLAFVHLSEREPTLCLVAEKTDQFSKAVPIDALPITDCAVCRLGPYETVLTRQDEEGWVVITPMDPSKLYLTPIQLDTPGLDVVRVRLRVNTEGQYVTQFQQDKDVARSEWQDWNPNKRSRK
ncbi:MAG: hypothetical protein KDD60_05085 [Bdellovibrionales bacterium]|nr:hypothetical protein [Bdellovibrionales bacterium]